MKRILAISLLAVLALIGTFDGIVKRKGPRCIVTYGFVPNLMGASAAVTIVGGRALQPAIFNWDFAGTVTLTSASNELKGCVITNSGAGATDGTVQLPDAVAGYFTTIMVVDAGDITIKPYIGAPTYNTIHYSTADSSDWIIVPGAVRDTAIVLWCVVADHWEVPGFNGTPTISVQADP